MLLYAFLFVTQGYYDSEAFQVAAAARGWPRFCLMLERGGRNVAEGPCPNPRPSLSTRPWLRQRFVHRESPSSAQPDPEPCFLHAVLQRC